MRARIISVLLIVAMLLAGASVLLAAPKPTFYWICHGSEGLPIFTIASNAARDTADLPRRESQDIFPSQRCRLTERSIRFRDCCRRRRHYFHQPCDWRSQG